MSVLGKLAGGVVSLGKQALEAAAGYVDRLANQQEFEAVIAACILVARADGSVDAEERAAMVAHISTHPSLSGFEMDAVQKTSKEFFELLGMDAAIGEASLYQRVFKLSDDKARAKIIQIVTAIANADGTFSDKEKAVVERIRAGV